ncbi:MAG: hypothetical protein ACYTCU_07295 [Planctomycetota bacterium]|jgi:hypothetical protein
MTRNTSPRFRPALLLLALALFIGTTGCAYNQHRNFGATEKWVGSDVDYVTKVTGTFFLSLGDSILSPVTMLCDQVARDPQYHPEHKYYSYSGSRTIARSDMGLGYQWMTMFPALIIETVWFPITGLVDMVTVLGFGDDMPMESYDDSMATY